MVGIRQIVAIALMAGALAAGAALARADSLAVVELYTSQGCSSCPPADELLTELAQRPDVLALGFHVDYWDYIGWKDPFALPVSGKRQRAYADNFNERYVYTPAMVVQGAGQVAGTRAAAVERMIREARATAPVAAVDVARKNGAVAVSIGAGSVGDPADVWLVVYDRSKTTDIGRGENAGRTLTYSNVVRAFRRIGQWDGSATELAVPGEELAGRGGCAVLVQEAGQGRILGAARLEMATR